MSGCFDLFSDSINEKKKETGAETCNTFVFFQGKRNLYFLKQNTTTLVTTGKKAFLSNFSDTIVNVCIHKYVNKISKDFANDYFKVFEFIHLKGV